MKQATELKTVKDFIFYAIARFENADLYYGHGTENPTDEAFALVFATLNISHSADDSVLEKEVSPEQKSLLLEYIETRITKKIPVPYITHEAWFCGLKFYVNENVLIPRSPTAELIIEGFEPWIDSNQVKNILDLCTGSGCIAIACAIALPEAQVDASDISKQALEVAKFNVEKYQLQDRVKLIESDLFNQIPDKKYDVIISNPPYVSEEEMQELPGEYNHEPELALTAGPQGLDFADIILRDAKKFLNPNGILIVEVGNSEYALAEKYPELPFVWLEFENGGGGVFLLHARDIA